MPDFEPDSSATRRLLSDVAAGDDSAFENLFSRNRRWLYRFVELRFDRRLRARVDPDDVVQETQLEAFRRLNDYLRRRPMPFRLWLQKTAYERLSKARRRHVRAARRSIMREMPLPDRSSRILLAHLLGKPEPSQGLSHQELIRRVGEAVAQLGELDREILVMRSYEGLSYDEVAVILEIEPAAARKRYGRALLRLRKTLDDRGLLEDDA